jgi:hypothetical protein
MIDDIVLFCGGPQIYGDAVPKPLSKMPDGSSVLVNYLRHQLMPSESITLMVESEFVQSFTNEVSQLSKLNDKLRIVSCEQGSSTLEKMKRYLMLNERQTNKLLFTYPDVFYFGPPSDFFKLRFHEPVSYVSIVPLRSRFSQLAVDIYSSEVKSVSLRPVKMPANSTFIFGGHFFSDRKLIEKLLASFDDSEGPQHKLTLEGDFLKYLISNSVLESVLLSKRWVKADSVAELYEIQRILNNGWDSAEISS